MTGTKRWIRSIQTESRELIDKIIWNSSSSSDEDIEDGTKRRKLTSLIRNSEEKSETFVDTESKNEDIEKKTNLCSKIINPESYGDLINSTSQISSPIIGRKIKKDESPLLTCGSINTHLTEVESPILTYKNITPEISPVIDCKLLVRRRNKVKKSFEIDNLSQDIFISHNTQLIEQNSSPELATQKSRTHSPESNQIELISSQDSSSIGVIDTSTTNSSLKNSNHESNYYHQPNLKRRGCKKGGFLHQINKKITLHASRISLWHHDIFCKNIIPSQLDQLNGVIRSKWKDFGCTIIECSNNGSKGVDVGSDLFLICLGHNLYSNSVYIIGQVIQVFPPFKEKWVSYQNKKVKLFFNISKMLSEVESSNKI